MVDIKSNDRFLSHEVESRPNGHQRIIPNYGIFYVQGQKLRINLPMSRLLFEEVRRAQNSIARIM